MHTRVIPPIPDSIWRNPLHFIAFGFGTGSLPFAPGTFGTLIAIPIYLLLQPLSHSVYLAVVTVITLLSIWICDKASRDIGVHDHQGMCLDEIVGFLITMYSAPHGIKWIIMGFLLFRLFDIWKPWPIHLLDEKVKGGLGIILDDVAAGIYSCIILKILSWIF